MLRVVIVGCGFMGRMHASVYGILDKAKLVAIVDEASDRREEFSKAFGVPAYASLDEALAKEEVDAVDICLPTDLHCEYTLRAAAAGKHVFC